MSGLRERLQRFRGDAAVKPAAPSAAPAQPSLGERLRRLGSARVGAAKPAHNAGVVQRQTAVAGVGIPDDSELAGALGAERLADGVLRLAQYWPLALRHGHCSLDADPAAVRLFVPEASADPACWIAMDTETSGLAGGTGTWVFLVGLAHWRNDRLELIQYLLTRLDAEADFLACVRAELTQAALLLSYNGKTFDLPLLSARLRLARMEDVANDIPHLDLLHPVRRAFAPRWPDCRLASVEQRLLGHRRAGDLPGAEAPAAWLDWLRRGDGHRLQGVLAHNRTDLVSVAALPARLAAAHLAPAAYGADPLRIARWRLAAGDAEAARRVLAHVGAAAMEPEARYLLGGLHARAGDWSAALELWQRLDAEGHTGACEALSKHFEHRVKDPAQALAYARRLPPGPETERRCRRLAYKIRRDFGHCDGVIDLADEHH
ncbi:MAG: ribonuclease H-like domain-containing protein [Thiohalocapsa sp.]|jgi:hypothetical protein